MFLSIIIPIWNDEKYLEECLDSCLNQALSGDEYEIICVDDGSTDRTPEILSEYERKHTNIHVIHAQHQGGSLGRKTGLGTAKGDYVWFVDHDDFIALDAVSTLFAFHCANPDCDSISFPYYQFFEFLTEEEKANYHKRTLKANDNDRHHNAVVWDRIFSRRFLSENGIDIRSERIQLAKEYWGKDSFPVMGTDTLFIQECNDKGMRCDAITNEPLYFYRRHWASESMNRDKKAVAAKDEQLFNHALVEIYLAAVAKEQYTKERSLSGTASQNTTINMIVKTRGVVKELVFMDRRYWKEGMRLLAEKKVFFSQRPPEYPLRFHEYLKLFSRRERMSPSKLFEYYTFTKAGARGFRFAKLWWRLREKIAFWHKLKWTYLAHRNQIRGLEG